MIPFLKKNKDGKKPPKSTVPRTAQESIPFQRMFEDGTCRVRPGYYTRTIQYQDTEPSFRLEDFLHLPCRQGQSRQAARMEEVRFPHLHGLQR